VVAFGLPEKGVDGRAMDEVIDRALFETLDSLPRAKKRDADAACAAIVSLAKRMNDKAFPRFTIRPARASVVHTFVRNIVGVH